MKKIIRSTGLYREDTPSPVLTQPVDPWAKLSPTAEQSSVVQTLAPKNRPRLLPVNHADERYTEEYERECIAWADAGCPDLAPSSPVEAFLLDNGSFTPARIIEGLEAAKLVQRYRMVNSRTSMATVPLHRGTTWRILEHADGTHTAFNADFGGHRGVF